MVNDETLSYFPGNANPVANALHSAPSIEMIRFLPDHGAAIDGRDDNGATYLHTAVANEEIEDIARLLIERGANVNAPDKDGATPLVQVASVKIARTICVSRRRRL